MTDPVGVLSFRHRKVSLLLVLLVSQLAQCRPESKVDDTKLGKAIGADKEANVLLLPQSQEDVIRPLENMADRFLKSETVGVVDSFAAHAIATFARFVDGAGHAMVEIIDGLPKTIDRVADTVDGMVRSADSIGRGVAVLVTAPARVVLTGLNPEFDNNSIRRRTRIQDQEGINSRINSDSRINIDSSINSDSAAKDVESSAAAIRRRRITLLERMLNRRENRASTPREILRSIVNRHQNQDDISSTRSLEDFNGRPNVIRATNLGSTRAKKNAASSSNGSEGPERNLINSDNLKEKNNNDVRRNRLGFLGLGSLGANFRRNSRNTDSSVEEREKSVFEKNFEVSRTQASIDRLEGEFGSFLGRLIGTIYRNADHIDESLSMGLRRVLGVQTATFSSISGSSGGNNNQSSIVNSETTTKAPVQFRLSFDDIDPAPARNTDLGIV